MRILIEEHKYNVEKVRDILHGIDALENIEGEVSIHYVGYYYNSLLRDCVLILPKVLMDENEKVFGRYNPEDILNLEKNNPLQPIERNFLYKFAVWIYRAIVVYKNSKDADSDIVYHVKIAQMGRGHRRLTNTYLDILLELIQFSKDNQDFLFFIVKNTHSGLNKINWTRTISISSAIIQEQSPVYLKPINKKRQVNFDEELLIIYYSILNYINEKYGFTVNINCRYQLIIGKRFETYLNGFGKTRLRQIKYKYFSDKALELWALCDAFFEEAKSVYVNTEKREYLLVKNFYTVFEAIIDELIGQNPLPDKMQKKQEDGKIVDHLFTAKSLIEGQKSQTYYIGDSKYYKIGHDLTEESIYKQYTYARNVIQWNIDIYNNGGTAESGVKLMDEETEGYNIIPNFFISAKLDKNFDYSIDGIEQTNREKNKHKKTHFKNRLYDRDTLLLFHYDVNFLFVLSLYARNNALQKKEWKKYVRDKFRTEIQEWLEKDYDFYAMKARPGINTEEYFRNNFRLVLGKTFTPFKDEKIYSLALDKTDPDGDNEDLKTKLRMFFYLEPCKLGNNPTSVIKEAEEREPSFAVQPERTGILIVNTKDYMNDMARYAETGLIAVGIFIDHELTFEIMKNLSRIGYILFVQGYSSHHLFNIKGNCEIVSKDNVRNEYIRNIDTMKHFITLEINPNEELDSSNIYFASVALVTTPMYFDMSMIL